MFSLQCLGVLAHEIETKEQLALLIVQPVLFALDVSNSARRDSGTMLYSE